jgi:cytochrome c peroxidase
MTSKDTIPERSSLNDHILLGYPFPRTMAAPQSGQQEEQVNLGAMGVSELKKYITSRGGSLEGCIEKADLLAAAVGLPVSAPAATTNALSWDVIEVRAAIFKILRSREARNHDDGSYAPLFIRLAWHCCGTYDKASNTGGSNGGTMRFDAEAADPENAGLDKARRVLEPVYDQFQDKGLSHSDLWVLAGYLGLEFAGGPRIPYRRGRRDFTKDESEKKYGPKLCPFGDANAVTSTPNPCGSRLPAADLGPDETVDEDEANVLREAPTIKHVRATFSRMGFSDRETVALIVLGHQFGRAHLENSGFEHPWYVSWQKELTLLLTPFFSWLRYGFAPTEWNVYEHGLGYLSALTMGDQMYFREATTSAGKRQYQTQLQGAWFMMLISDMALKWDPGFKKHLTDFDRNRRGFIKEAADAWVKLTENGCEDLQA